MPTLEGVEGTSHRSAVGPVLAVPLIVLGPANKIQQPPARNEVVHKVRAGADPRLRSDLESEVADTFSRHQSAIGDAAGEGRGLLAEQRGTHCRMNAVGAD